MQGVGMIFHGLMAESLPDMINVNSQVVQITPNRINTRTFKSRHIIIKL